MSEHSLEVIGAYLDGELQGDHLKEFELHLTGCDECQKNIESLSGLSTVLHQVQVPDFDSPEFFVEKVSLQLPRKKIRYPFGQNILVISWYSIPLFLMAVWVFLNTTYLISSLLITANFIDMVNLQSSTLFSGVFKEENFLKFLDSLGWFENVNFQWLVEIGGLTRRMISNLIWQISIALLYLFWLVIWWTRRKVQGAVQPLDS
jgi:hypothetical protein